MNIFVTVGAQMPFDRLIKAVDYWAEARRGLQIFAQIGSGSYEPKNMRAAEFVEPERFYERVRWSDLMVSHAGMGSILTALQHGKPIIVLPRQGRLKETRNDHQLASASRFARFANVAVAQDEKDLQRLLDTANPAGERQVIAAQASDELLGAVRDFIRAARP